MSRNPRSPLCLAVVFASLLAGLLAPAGCCLTEVSGIGNEGTTGGATSGEGIATGGSTTGQVTGMGSSTGQTTSACGLIVSPNVLDFGSTFTNTTATRSVTLIDKCYPVAGITAAVYGGDENLFVAGETPSTLEAGASATVNISYSPLAIETRSLATVLFSGSDGEQAALNLFGEPISIGVSPDPIEFGNVGQNESASGCTMVSCESGRPVTITGIGDLATEGGAFGVVTMDFPVTVDAGDSVQICFSLTCAMAGDYTGEATLLLDDPQGINSTVQLTGSCGGL